MKKYYTTGYMSRLERELSPRYQETVAPPEHHPVRELLWRTLHETSVEKGYEPDRKRQQDVFDRITWDTFITELASESKGTGEGAGKRLRGKLFEMLIQADPAFGQRSALEKELLALAHNPDAFGLGKILGHHRNPDMAFLIVQKEDGVEITGVGESKLGLLNERSYKQLSETGFARGVKALVEVVNTLPDPASHGLVEVAKARKTVAVGKPLLTIAPEFTQLLVVPANRNIAWQSSLINRKEFTMEGRQRFYELLSDIRHVRTANAAFSTAEVSAMARVLTTKR
jgi:hypothetical protein